MSKATDLSLAALASGDDLHSVIPWVMLNRFLGWLDRLSIGQRLAVAFGMMAVLLIAGFVTTLLNLSRINSYVDRHWRITIPGMIAASEMLRNIRELQTLTYRVRHYDTENERASDMQTLVRIESKILATLDFYKTTHAVRTHPILYGMLKQHRRVDLAEEEDRALKMITAGMASLRIQREAGGTVFANNTSASMESPYEHTMDETADTMTLLLEVHRKIDVEMKIEGDRIVSQARLVGVSTTAVLGLLMATVYLMMQRYVAVPLKRLSETADRVAHHDHTVQFASWTGRDEVGRLTDSLSTMLASLRERRNALIRKTKELESFSSSIAHDLKGPLREIEGFSSLLEKQLARGSDRDQMHYIATIRKSTLRLTHMIEELLKYSRLERRELPCIRFNALELINGLVADFQRQRESGRFRVEIALPFSDLYGEPVSIRQAIDNVLNNALKFSRHAAIPIIEIGGRQTQTERVLWIRDNGIGFDMSHHEKIFRLFERLHGASEYEGTGVGLAIVKMVVEKHGGRVWAESAKGQGSTFYLAFPNMFDTETGLLPPTRSECNVGA